MGRGRARRPVPRRRVLELLGAARPILPAVLGIAPTLVSLAAVGLALTMIGAIVTHLRLGETDRLAVPIVVLAPALFVAVERSAPTRSESPVAQLNHHEQLSREQAAERLVTSPTLSPQAGRSSSPRTASESVCRWPTRCS